MTDQMDHVALQNLISDIYAKEPTISYKKLAERINQGQEVEISVKRVTKHAKTVKTKLQAGNQENSQRMGNQVNDNSNSNNTTTKKKKAKAKKEPEQAVQKSSQSVAPLAKEQPAAKSQQSQPKQQPTTKPQPQVKQQPPAAAIAVEKKAEAPSKPCGPEFDEDNVRLGMYAATATIPPMTIPEVVPKTTGAPIVPPPKTTSTRAVEQEEAHVPNFTTVEPTMSENTCADYCSIL